MEASFGSDRRGASDRPALFPLPRAPRASEATFPLSACTAVAAEPSPACHQARKRSGPKGVPEM